MKNGGELTKIEWHGCLGSEVNQLLRQTRLARACSKICMPFREGRGINCPLTGKWLMVTMEITVYNSSFKLFLI